MEINGARVWITGASSGIGAALARELADRGAAVAISARNVEKLREVAAGRMHVEPVDVTDRQATVAAAAAVRAALGGLDVAVLNAGTWSRFRVDDWDSGAFAEHLQTNLMGTVHALEGVVPAMLAQGRGRIVGTASVAGYRGLPGSEAYGATQGGAAEPVRGAARQPRPTRQSSSRSVAPGLRQDADDRPQHLPDAVHDLARGGGPGDRRRHGEGQGRDRLPVPMMLLMKAARLVPVRVWTAATAAMTRRGMTAALTGVQRRRRPAGGVTCGDRQVRASWRGRATALASRT